MEPAMNQRTNYEIADALRAYAICLENCPTNRLRTIAVDDLRELVLTIADILDRPLPELNTRPGDDR
jgi:hypothetical protein